MGNKGFLWYCEGCKGIGTLCYIPLNPRKSPHIPVHPMLHSRYGEGSRGLHRDLPGLKSPIVTKYLTLPPYPWESLEGFSDILLTDFSLGQGLPNWLLHFQTQVWASSCKSQSNRVDSDRWCHNRSMTCKLLEQHWVDWSTQTPLRK